MCVALSILSLFFPIPLFCHFYKNALHRSRGSTDSIQAEMRHIRWPALFHFSVAQLLLDAVVPHFYQWIVRPSMSSNEYLMNYPSSAQNLAHSSKIFIPSIRNKVSCVCMVSRHVSALDIVRRQFFWCFFFVEGSTSVALRIGMHSTEE